MCPHVCVPGGDREVPPAETGDAGPVPATDAVQGPASGGPAARRGADEAAGEAMSILIQVRPC